MKSSPMTIIQTKEIKESLIAFREQFLEGILSEEELKNLYESLLPKSYYHGFQRFLEDGLK